MRENSNDVTENIYPIHLVMLNYPYLHLLLFHLSYASLTVEAEKVARLVFDAAVDELDHQARRIHQ